MTVAIETLTDAQAAAIFAALVRPVAFSATVPLDGNKVMAAQPVSGVIAFQPGSNPMLGAQCYIRLTADGTNLPTFAGFTEHGSSAGYFNTAGVVNLLRFWYDGTSSWFAIAQALNVVPFVMQSGAIPNSAPTKIDVTFDRDMNQTITPAAAAFTVTSTSGGSAVTDAISAAAWTSARTLRLTKSRTTLAADTVVLSYTVPGANPLTDATGNVAGARANMPVTNNVAASASTNFITFANATGATATANGDGSTAYQATGNGGWGGGSAFGVSTASLPAGAAGFVEFQVVAGFSGTGPLLGFQTGTTITGFADQTYTAGVNGTIKHAGSADVGYGDTTTVLAPAANAWIRLERTFSNNVGTMKIRYSADGTTYNDIYTFPNPSSEKLYVSMDIGASDPNAGMKRIRASSNVA